MTSDDTDIPVAGDTATDTHVTADEPVPPTDQEQSAEDNVQPPEAGDPSDGDDSSADVGGPTREGMAWYVLRVASNKEGQIREALERKVKIEALEDHVGRILVPTVKEKRIKAGRAKVLERKLYPGYVFVEMATEEDGAIPEHVWFLVKETMGVGDFIGSDGKPTPMAAHDVDKLLEAAQRSAAGDAASAIPYKKGDRVKIREGSFENFEGEVDSIDEKSGSVTVLVTIFGRSTPVDVEYWQLERL